MNKPLTVCSNPECEKPIYKDEQVWFKGNDFYCHLQCVVASFENKEVQHAD